jgi:endonuclease/exonuclease/phosphatase (EEP) superfamily protein YafD
MHQPMIPRPTSLLGLLLRAASLRRKSVGCALTLGVLVVLAGLAVLAALRAAGCATAPPRLATFNIENYPRSAAQEEGAFDAIRALSAPAIALQEITDPGGFCAAARRRLGDSWDCAFSDRPVQRVGIVYDRSALELLATAIHSETEVYDGAKPTFEARLRPRGGGAALRMFVVHLKARGDGGAVRAEQLRALAPVIATASGSGDQIVVLGDFNATGPGDVETIAAFARSAGLHVASEDVPCTAYWNRNDGCLGVALDQVLTSFRADVHAEGPCRTEGCAMRPACPTFHGTVSDHCPVTIDF